MWNEWNLEWPLLQSHQTVKCMLESYRYNTWSVDAFHEGCISFYCWQTSPVSVYLLLGLHEVHIQYWPYGIWLLDWGRYQIEIFRTIPYVIRLKHFPKTPRDVYFGVIHREYILLLNNIRSFAMRCKISKVRQWYDGHRPDKNACHLAHDILNSAFFVLNQISVSSQWSNCR